MRKLLLALALLCCATSALAQNTQCSDRPAADSSNACANTRFVQNHPILPGAITLGQNHILVGSISNLATDVAMSGDCTIVASGAITCSTLGGLSPFNANNISSGTLGSARLPAFGSGDVSFATAGGAGTIAAAAVTNAKMANMNANTVKGNATGGAAAPTDILPATARTVSLLNIDGYTGHGDSIYTILAADRTVGTTATLTASRVWTLPAASAFNPGQELLIADFFGGVTATNTIVVTRAGSDTINGATTTTINAAFSSVLLRSDGVAKWSVLSTSSAGAASTLFKSPMDSPYNALCDGSTNDTTAIQAWLDGIKTNAFTGWVPAGKTCIYTGLLSMSSGTTIFGYGATFKQKSSDAGSANSGLVCGPTSQLGGPIDQATIYGLTMDGNRAGNTNSAGSGAMFYCPRATRVRFRDIRAINGRGDGIYVGGTTTGGGQGRSTWVYLDNVEASTNYRNGMSVVGVDRGVITGGLFNSSSNTNNDGPQCGVDFEPNDANSANSNIVMTGASSFSNGGTLSTTGGSGFCGFGANQTEIVWQNLFAASNQRWGYDSAQTTAQITMFSMRGSGGASGIVSGSGGYDFTPSGVGVGAPNSCTAGFRCVTHPN